MTLIYHTDLTFPAVQNAHRYILDDIISNILPALCNYVQGVSFFPWWYETSCIHSITIAFNILDLENAFEMYQASDIYIWTVIDN